MTDTLTRPDKRETLYITDAELIRRMGVPEKIARANIKALDEKRTDFPKKDKFWGGRRYWPAVKAWLDRNSGLKMDAPQPRRTP
jgi:hypothetical protein